MFGFASGHPYPNWLLFVPWGCCGGKVHIQMGNVGMFSISFCRWSARSLEQGRRSLAAGQAASPQHHLLTDLCFYFLPKAP